jgi:hypothetical protein
MKFQFTLARALFWLTVVPVLLVFGLKAADILYNRWRVRSEKDAGSVIDQVEHEWPWVTP